MVKPWFFLSGGGYSPLPQDETLLPQHMSNSPFSFDSIHSYDKKNRKGDKGKKKYKSIFDWNKEKSLEGERDVEGVAVDGPNLMLRLFSLMLTGFSYLVFGLGLPVMYWVCVLKLGQHDRLVVFRLGKMIGVKGPGRVVIFPWMDRWDFWWTLINICFYTCLVPPPGTDLSTSEPRPSSSLPSSSSQTTAASSRWAARSSTPSRR